MSTQLSHQRSRHWMATWTAGPRLGRLATVLAAVVTGLLASAAAATAALIGLFLADQPRGDVRVSGHDQQCPWVWRDC